MDSLAKSEVFFFVTTIAVGLFTIVGVVIAVYLVKILRNINAVSELASAQASKISGDIDLVRETIKEEGWRAIKRLNFFAKWFGGKKSKNT